MTNSDKHSSLLQYITGYVGKNIYSTGPKKDNLMKMKHIFCWRHDIQHNNT